MPLLRVGVTALLSPCARRGSAASAGDFSLALRDRCRGYAVLYPPGRRRDAGCPGQPRPRWVQVAELRPFLLTPALITSTAAPQRSSASSAGENRGADPAQDLTSADTPKKSSQDSEPQHGKPTKAQQLKKVFKEYGAVGVSFHVGISLMSLGMFYLAVSSGIDMAALLFKLGFNEAVVQSKMAAGTSTFVLAYAVHKLFAPVRISITLVSVPLIVRYFRKAGLFKPPASTP
ncbi:protein FAM210B, mitochondrial [Denticeps clupeoides]|uniref:DUF1279 domain-containing protein n=1 Tax=Denticeps clupeoides TaxID=299321 RepID=A0AAY4B7M9_9TELE|nr:protein FAM210B, mitochondrial [Denticeps clupeoides]